MGSHAPSTQRFCQKLLLIWYNVFYDYKTSPLAKEIIARVREKEPDVALTRRALAYPLRPEDVMKMMLISKRQAIEHIKFFKIIYSDIPE